METRSAKTKDREHVFYISLAVLLGLTVFAGFSRTYYLKGVFGTPRLSWILHVHGAVFTVWVLFFVWQTGLAATRRISLHRRVGWIGAGFAAGVVALGIAVAMHSVRAGYASGRPNMPFLLVGGVFDLGLFSMFFVGALLLRSNKELHKRLMMLAMISLIIPAIARLPIPFVPIGWRIFGLSLLVFVYDAAYLRRVHLINIAGVLLINICSPLRFIIAGSPGWQNFTRWIAR
jgi:hypothetical protein